MSEDSDVADGEPSPPDGSEHADSDGDGDDPTSEDHEAESTEPDVDAGGDSGESEREQVTSDGADHEAAVVADEESESPDASDAESEADGESEDVPAGADDPESDSDDAQTDGVDDAGTDDDTETDDEEADTSAAPATEPALPDQAADGTAPYAAEVEEEPQSFMDDEDDGGILGEGPESDEEMPLADHIEEMMRRLGVVFLVAGTATLLVYGVGQFVETIPSAIDIINYLWNHNIPGAPQIEDRRPRLYGPLELVLTELKVAGLAGLVVGLPAFVYETYRFMRPGLYPHERRYYLAAVPTSLVLALVGITFANFVVVPAIFSYFTSYTEASGTVVAFGLRETFNLILLLMGYMAVVFQIPLFMMLAIMMNLTSRRWMEDRRLLFWGAFLGLAFVVSPDPTGMAPIIIAATMITLFEGTLALLRWTGN